jgi:hypothetical protein
MGQGAVLGKYGGQDINNGGPGGLGDMKEEDKVSSLVCFRIFFHDNTLLNPRTINFNRS